ncbi:MAG: spore germination protein [Oscillospiraceae bacterium]|jgi:spore germination protein KA
MSGFFSGFMNKNFPERKNKIIEKSVSKLNNSHKKKLNMNLCDNISLMNALFIDDDIFVLREFGNNYSKKLKYCIAYCDGVVKSEMINDNIIRPLMLSSVNISQKDIVEQLIREVIMIYEVQITQDVCEIIEAVTYGNTILFVDGSDKAVILDTKGFATRAITEPDSERTLSGPREGFNESLMQNLSLIRRRLRTNELKIKFMSLGRCTRTKTCVCYIEGLVNKKVLAELISRLEKIDIDGVLDTNYITELIRDSRWSPFRATGYTERPDTVVGKLLEGRIAIILDGTPMVLTVPYLFIENFQSNEDYYFSFYYSSFARMLRIFGFFLTVTIPGLFILVVAFHHEMLPTRLLINVAGERANVPLPASLEIILLIIVFDILRETGVRMPSNVGQALSIVGALVIGESAVEAKLVAAPMIIIVAMTGITGLLVPKLNAPVIYIRMFLLVLSSTFGFFGFMIGASILIIHILNLTSLNIPQITISGYFYSQHNKDIFIRAPWWNMRERPQGLTKNKVRIKTDSGEKNG